MSSEGGLASELGRAVVAALAASVTQRSPEWVRYRKRRIGGSEIGAVMGASPYSRYHNVVATKLGIAPFKGNAACWWGVFFEPVVERVAAIDLGTHLFGTDVLIPAPAGSVLENYHSNSPDGLCVVRAFMGEGGVWEIVFTDPASQARAAGKDLRRFVALLEFKCPQVRIPARTVPKHYKAQVLSGLALLPFASFGLYVDTVFRKCGLRSLGPESSYDHEYHPAASPITSPPVCWGFSLLSLARDAPSEHALVVDTLFAEFSLDDYRHEGVVDLGAAPPDAFNAALRLVSDQVLRAQNSEPCFADGRGIDLHSPGAVQAAIAQLHAATGGLAVVGVLSWKAFEINYCGVTREPGFLERAAPAVKSCIDTVERLSRADDPHAAYWESIDDIKKAGASLRASCALSG